MIRTKPDRACPALRRPDRLLQPDPHRAAGAARRDLQSRRAEPRRGLVRGAGIHGQCRRHRHAAAAGGDPHPGAREEDALLPGLDLGALRPGPGDPAEGDDALLSALALCGRQALRLLDHGQLPRGLRHVRLQRHPVQSRIARSAARPSSRARSPAALARINARPAGLPLPRQPRRQARLGPCEGLCRDAVAACCSRTSRRISCIATGEQHSVREFVECRRASSAWSDRAGKAQRASTRSGDRRHVSRQGASSRVDPRYFRPTEVETLLGDPDQGAREARLGAADRLRGSGARNDRGRPRGRASATPWSRATASLRRARRNERPLP